MRKHFKVNDDIDLDPTMPNVELEEFSYPTILVCSNFKILDHLFFELSCLHTERHCDRGTPSCGISQCLSAPTHTVTSGNSNLFVTYS